MRSRSTTEGSTRNARCQFANAILERLDGLVGNPSLDHPPWCFEESIAEEFAAEDAGNGALGLVHRQVKSAIKTPQQGHHPFTRPPRHRRCSRRHSGRRHGPAVQAPCPPHPTTRWPEAAHEGLRRQDGIMRAPSRTEAVAVLAEGRIEDRLQDLQERLRASRFVARSPWSAPPHIRFLSIGPQLRSTLPPHGRSPFRSCASLRSP